jgi:hypothetical protein
LPIARDPTPPEAMMLTEIVEQIMAKLKKRERVEAHRGQHSLRRLGTTSTAKQ